MDQNIFKYVFVKKCDDDDDDDDDECIALEIGNYSHYRFHIALEQTTQGRRHYSIDRTTVVVTAPCRGQSKNK